MKHYVVGVLLLLTNVVWAQLEDENRILNQYIVLLKPSHEVKELMAELPALQTPVCLSQHMNIWLLERSTAGNAAEFLDTLRGNPYVKLAQFNHRIKQRSVVPNDPYFNQQWNLKNVGQQGGIAGDDIDATDAWAVSHNNLTVAGDTMVIAIVDVGFDLTHNDLNFFVNHHEIPNNGLDDDSNGYVDDYYGWNALDNNGQINASPIDHSMHCSGIAGAITNDSLGIAGVSWGTQIMRVSGASDAESQVVAAYAYIIAMRLMYDTTNGAKGAFVVSTNSSFGIDGGQPADYPIWCAMYDSMGAYGILSATATADNGTDIDLVGDMPTGCPSKYMISVTNTTSSDVLLANGAAYGKISIDLGAPGTNIYSTITNNGYEYMTGTSMSAPHVAGAVAEMLGAACPKMIADYKAHPADVALALKNMMLTGATRLSDLYNKTQSGGRLNLYHAVLNLDEYNCSDCADVVSLAYTQPTCSDSCNGTATVTATGTAGYVYNWSIGDTGVTTLSNLCPGFYSVTVTDISGCSQTRNFSLFRPDSINILSIDLRPAVPGDSGNIIVIASAGNYGIEYSLDSVNYQSGSTLIVSNNGNYNVFVKSETGCVIERNVTLTGIQDYGSGFGKIVSISPNPATDVLNISLNLPQSANLEFTILNVLGETAIAEDKQVPSGMHTATADISSLAGGVYLLRVASGNSFDIQKFIVVNK